VKDENKPKSVWVTEFNTESVEEFYNDYVDLEHDPMIQIVPIFINSFGGQVYSMIAKRDIIKSSDKPTATIALGKAMSCGASLLAAGTKGMRFASPDTRILIHEVSSMSRGKATDIKEDAVQIQALNNLMLSNLAIDTGIHVDKWKKEMSKRGNADWVLTAPEAIKWGIIDHIGVPRHSYTSTKTDLSLSIPNVVKKIKRVRK